MTRRARWSARAVLNRASTPAAIRLHHVLRPEARRGTARAEASIRQSARDVIWTVTAQDTSALRAALNTYLSWLHLALATESEASPTQASPEREDLLG